MSIASRITEIETHIGDVYNTIDYSYDTTGVNKNIINIPKYLKKGYIDIINNGIDTLYNNFPKVSGIGSNLSLTPTYEAPMKLNEIHGDTLQDGTPTPDTPVEIQSVTGLQNVEVCGKNLFDAGQSYALPANENYSQAIGEIYLEANNKYYFSYNVDNDSASNTRSTMYLQIGTGNRIYQDAGSNKNLTAGRKVWEYTPTESATYNVGYWLHTSNVAVSISNFMISTSSDTTYEPYKGNTYEVNLGKNLLNLPDGTYTHNGITAVVSNGKITINGTANGTSFIGINVDLSLQKGNYVLSNNNSKTINDGSTYIRFDSDGNTICTFLAQNVSKTLTLSSNTNYSQLVIRTTSGITFDNFEIYPQLEKGSQATSYSPYFTPIELNGIPETEYKDSIKKSSGKNLFDKNNVSIISGVYINNSNGEITSGGTSSVINNILVISNTTYTLTAVGKNKIAFYDSNNNYLSNITSNLTTFTTPANCKYIKIQLATETLNVNTIQLELGTQQTTYEPYGKVWYIEKKIGKVVLIGASNEEWTQIDNLSYSDTILRFTTNITDKKPNTGNTIKDNILSDKFTCKILNDNSARQTNSIAGQSGLVRINLFIDKTIIGGTDITSLTTWLSTHNTEVLYVLNTPTTTEITNTELIENLETLYTAKSQEGTTNIFITSEDLEMILNVSALKGDV